MLIGLFELLAFVGLLEFVELLGLLGFCMDETSYFFMLPIEGPVALISDTAV